MRSSPSSPEILCGVLLAVAALGCDAEACVRNSDCLQPLVCASGACALPPADGGATDGIVASAPDSFMTEDTGIGTADSASEPDADGDSGLADAAGDAAAGDAGDSAIGDAVAGDAGDAGDADAADGGDGGPIDAG